MKSEPIQLPKGIDPSTPVGQLTHEDHARIHASINARRRWKNVGKRERRKLALAMVAARAEH